jgi:hypothetical protein
LLHPAPPQLGETVIDGMVDTDEDSDVESVWLQTPPTFQPTTNRFYFPRIILTFYIIIIIESYHLPWF